ncbi:MAG: S8 family serine peptidase [Acidobacteriota bacterium]
MNSQTETVKPSIGSIILRPAQLGIAGLALLGLATPALAQDADRGDSPKNDGAPQTLVETYVASDGTHFIQRKNLAEDGAVVYIKDGQVYDAAALAQYERDNPRPTIDDALLRAALERGSEPIEVMVWLRNQPGTAIAAQVRDLYAPELAAHAEDVQAIQRQLRPSVSLTPDEERGVAELAERGLLRLTDAQRAQVREAHETVDTLQSVMQAEIRRQTERAIAGDQAYLADAASALDGAVLQTIVSQNGARVRLPGKYLGLLAEDPAIAQIAPVNVGAPDLDNHQTSLGVASGFWANGIDGGVWDAGVLDTGVQQNHPNLDHLRFFSDHGSTDSNGHGTAVAGVIASDHASFRGIAFGLDAMLVGDASDGESDADWMVGGGHDDPEAINLSWNYGMVSEDYDGFDRFYDNLVEDHRVLVAKSASNFGNGTSTLGRPASAYNVITVANMNDMNTVARGDDVITASSSRGPTIGGRKKPDITAPGKNTRTTNNDWQGSNPDFIDFGGTSAAAPHVAGAALLVTDLRGNDDPRASKAVLINAADAWDDGGTSGDTSDDGQVNGSHWDKTYGWGYLDLWEAWFNGTDLFIDTVDKNTSTSTPEHRFYRGQMFTNEKATLVWHRHVNERFLLPDVALKLTDLDLRAYHATTGTHLESSASGVDNVEQIAVDSSQDTVLKVDIYGSLDGDLSSESYALATEENFVRVQPPVLAPTGPGIIGVSGLTETVTMTVRNNGELNAYNTVLGISVPSGWVIIGSSSRNVGTVAPGATRSATFTVRPTCSGEVHGFLGYNASSSSWGESFGGRQSQLVTCVGPGNPPGGGEPK